MIIGISNRIVTVEPEGVVLRGVDSGYALCGTVARDRWCVSSEEEEWLKKRGKEFLCGTSKFPIESTHDRPFCSSRWNAVRKLSVS